MGLHPELGFVEKVVGNFTQIRYSPVVDQPLQRIGLHPGKRVNGILRLRLLTLAVIDEPTGMGLAALSTGMD